MLSLIIKPLSFFSVPFGLASYLAEKTLRIFFKNVKNGDHLTSTINFEFDVEGLEIPFTGVSVYFTFYRCPGIRVMEREAVSAFVEMNVT